MPGWITADAILAHIDWSMVSAFAALVAALVAIAAIWRQERVTHFSIGIEMLRNLEEACTSDRHSLAARALAAKTLVAGEASVDVDDVLDFFQTVAFLHYR